MTEGAEALVAGRYRRIEQVGRGGMGVVWRAWDETLQREVAVKQLLLPPELPPDQAAVRRKRMVREARAAARLSHPAIITVFDVIDDGTGGPLVIMEYVNGPSLDRMLRERGPLSLAETLPIAEAVLGALRVAHASGIVHRDLKPSNVLIAGPRVVLTDFGIASLAGNTSLTGTDQLLGTPSYMAPEQARGQTATPASDLWSLGATLYACVEGHPPFDGSAAVSILSALLTADPPRPVRAGPLTSLIGRLLMKDAQRRATAEQAGTALAKIRDSLSQDTEIGTPPQASLTETWPHGAPSESPRSRNPAIVVGAVSLLIGALVTAAPFYLSGHYHAADGTSTSPSPEPSWEADRKPGHRQLALGEGLDFEKEFIAAGYRDVKPDNTQDLTISQDGQQFEAPGGVFEVNGNSASVDNCKNALQNVATRAAAEGEHYYCVKTSGGLVIRMYTIEWWTPDGKPLKFDMAFYQASG
ncbi:serine/threonine-protein kinase [Actinomadura oligospora]|uniref:serine/threonine-protein kinase n=1 Tax=Actinomadura oligospora TaxID=111804 RepID=UPI0004B71759|nr:serine/threonine-protein kinase [Actinomadura oligospora]